MSDNQPPECPTCGKRRWPVTHSCTGIRPVTAPTRGGADEIREQMAAVLPESLGPVGLRRRAIPALDVQGSVTGYGDMLLDALLPTVQALIAKGAAAELRGMGRAALRATPGAAPVTVPVGDLFARAEALDGPR